MEEKKNKMTVEQVKAAANEQIGILYEKLRDANLSNTFRRLDYLFKIVEGSFNKTMKDKASEEIDHIVFGYPNDKQEEKKEE